MEEAGPGSKVQRVCGVLPIAAVAGSVDFPSHSWLFHKPFEYDRRVASVVTKQDLEVPVHVNQDEEELLLTKRLDCPDVWYETEFPFELELAGMKKEMTSMLDFDVFTEVSTSSLSQTQLAGAISGRWVKVRKPSGEVRCRFVVRGFDQKIEDPDDTFASTPSLQTLKLMLTLSIAFDWDITCCDISTAFLHADISGEEIFVVPPAEYYPEGGIVWRLKKALYGLKNSPRLWQDHFAAVMKKLGFSRMKSDPNLYVHVQKRVYVLAYVDDLMVFGSRAAIDHFTKELSKDLLLKITGQLSEGNDVSFLGRNIRRTSDSIQLSMKSSYVETMIKTLGLETCKPAATPGVDALKKVVDSTPLPSEDHRLYRRVVGQLLWLSSVRMDIMYAVKELSRGLTSPTCDHMSKLKHLVRYLTSTQAFVQELRPTLKLSDKHKALDINVYVDSDWAGCPDTRRSTSGVSLFVLGANLVSHSRTQQTVALSSGEAELYAIGSGAAEALFARSLVMEARLFEKANITIFTDSTAGKSMAGRFGTSRKTKHVDLRFLYVQELVQTGMVKLRKVLGTLNPADIMTKYVGRDVLQRHLPTFGLLPSL